MKLKKAFAITAAAMLSIPCLSGLSASAQGYNAYLAGVYGESQENAVWSFDTEGNYPVPAECTTAVIDGDGTYEVEWVMQPLLYGPRTEFMCLFIDGLNNQTYPSLNITVDEILVDGTAIEYTQSSNACDYNYGGETTRVYLKDNWAGSKVADIDEYIQINDSIKIIFTVSGMGFDGSGDSQGDSQDSSEVSSESESSSVSEVESESEVSSESESSSVSESESEVSSESESSSLSEVESSSSIADSSSTVDSSSSADDNSEEKSEGGIKTWMILVGVLGVAAVAAVIVIIIKIRNSKYYL